MPSVDHQHFPLKSTNRSFLMQHHTSGISFLNPSASLLFNFSSSSDHPAVLVSEVTFLIYTTIHQTMIPYLSHSRLKTHLLQKSFQPQTSYHSTSPEVLYESPRTSCSVALFLVFFVIIILYYATEVAQTEIQSYIVDKKQ